MNMSDKSRASEYKRLCGTEKSRKSLAKQVEALAAKHGATVTRRENYLAKRCVGLTLAIGPYRCMMDFRGGSYVDAFLGHWHNETGSSATYPADFAASIRGSVNPYHRQKATTCSDTFEGFLASIESGLESLKANLAVYYDCGICGGIHQWRFNGDCRDNANRFTPDQLDAKHGPLSYELRSMEERVGGDHA